MATETLTAPPNAAANGAEPSEKSEPELLFPVDSFQAAAPHLRRPFTAAAVKFKVQATWKVGDDDGSGGALIVSYIDARLVIERLNLICPHLWYDAYEERGGALLCRLTVDGISRIDIGEGYEGKGLYSDALKRAAVKFGIGVSLYATPQLFLSEKESHLKVRPSRNGPTYVLTPSGEQACRSRYGAWLEGPGVQAFGQPLDHGDALNAVGDHEAEDEPAVDPAPGEPQPEPPANPLDPERVQTIGQGIGAMGLTYRQIDLMLGACGIDGLRAASGKALRERLESLTPEEADALEAELAKAGDHA